MGNKLSCSCAPLIRKAYRYEDSPWQATRRRDGHLLRLWAEVFHVSAQGNVKWQQVSEDLVPVNITCIQDTPECVFHITAYNSQVDKILDVRLVQPGTRLGQASECFVYWKDPATGDTWGLNFTSPIDAKQFRECCSPAFKFSRKASSSYSLKLDPPKKVKSKRKPLSTPSSPSRLREPQCTCMTRENLQHLQRMRAEAKGRITGAATLPRTQSHASENATATVNQLTCQPRGPMGNSQSSSSVYDNVGNSMRRGNSASTRGVNGIKHTKSDVSLKSALADGSGDRSGNQGAGDRNVGGGVGDLKKSLHDAPEIRPSLTRRAPLLRKEAAKSIDYSEMESIREPPPKLSNRRLKSKSSDDVFEQSKLGGSDRGRSIKTRQYTGGGGGGDISTLSLDSNTLKRMLQPMISADSADESFDRGSGYSRSHGHSYHGGRSSSHPRRFSSRPNILPSSRSSSQDYDRKSYLHSDSFRSSITDHSLYLDLDRDQSPPSDNILFDNQCYATTPSSSNGEGCYGSDDHGRPSSSGLPNSPTSRLLMEYEMHLRNTLARGLDAESYSLHTFEALLTHSMENLESIISDVHVNTMGNKNRNASSSVLTNLRDCNAYACGEKSNIRDEINRIHNRFRNARPRSSSPPMGKSSTLPLTHSKSGMHFSTASLAAALHEHNSIVQQASLESADSRLCYLTSSEISDDERMSLTTAISDDDDVESIHNSPYKSRISVVSSSTFSCTGAVRKAGFLSVKKWILRKKHQVELARKRGWKGYWVCLKGTTLLFYPCDNRDGRSIENTPKHLIIVDGAIMQPIPEHPKRDYIFCLSTAFGDAYLFQAPCQVELENWVNSTHNACAAAFARHRGKTGTLHLLQEEIYRLEKEIESDCKLRHMADLQLTVVSDAESRQTLLNQINQWEENLERLHCEQFRIRCYMASLQNTELPNPKNLLAQVSRGTKITLNRLGVFTVSSFHAYVSARSPSLLNNLLAGRGATKRRQSILSRSNSASSRRSLSLSREGTQDLPGLNEKPQKVMLPDSRSATVYVRDGMTAEEFLALSCSKKQLIPSDHFLRLYRTNNLDDYYVPHRSDLMENLSYGAMEVCAKILYQVELSRATLEQMWGFSVEAELIENTERHDELYVMVSRVEERSFAMQQGIIKGDEIMVINGAIVSDLDMMYIESVLQEELSLCMMMRSCRTEPPEYTNLMKTTDDYIEQLVCPPPPNDAALSEEMITGLIVPSPAWAQERLADRKLRGLSSKQSSETEQESSNVSSEQIETLLKTAEQVTSEYCRSPLPNQRRPTPPPSITPPAVTVGPTGRQMTDAEKLRKVVMELVDTEKTYVNHLNNLLEYYLEPLKKETFLSNAEINALFGNIQEIVAFQRVFLQSLDDAVESEPDFNKFEYVHQFKNVLFSLGGSFLYYANHFKLYSSFCASHSKAQKVLHPNEGNQSLQNFLQSRNPKQQHSSTLESYLIKPIQRILKYPLLLQQLKHLTDPSTDEHIHLAEALQEMEKVAEHINEMQRIHEEYGAIFDHLYRQHMRVVKQHVDLSPGELLYYGGVQWLNITDFLGKIKKGLELHAMCFVFKKAVVFLCKERIRQKKKLMEQGGSGKTNHSEVEIIRYQVLIPVTEVQVRAGNLRDVDSHYMWELIHLKSHVHRRSEKTYHLSNSNGEFRNSFLKTIRLIIRESVRNMSIPANKSHSKGDRYGDGFFSGLRPITGGFSIGVEDLNRTLSNKKKSPKGPQRHSAGNIANDASLETYDNVDQNFRTQSKGGMHGGDPGHDELMGSGYGDGSTHGINNGHHHLAKDYHSDKSDRSDKDFVSHKPMLGRTPNHLSLSTTSTLSTGSAGSSAAKLIQSSNPPSNYQPAKEPPAGSPVWKPRDGGMDRSPMFGGVQPDSSHTSAGGSLHPPSSQQQYFVYDEFGGPVFVTPPSAKKDQFVAGKQVDC